MAPRRSPDLLRPLFADAARRLRRALRSRRPLGAPGRAARRGARRPCRPADIDIRLSPDVHLVGDRIVIGPGTRIHPSAVIEGPVFIGRDVEIRPGAYIRGGIWIGDGCVVGANTEIKRAILLPARQGAAPQLRRRLDPRRRTSTSGPGRSSRTSATTAARSASRATARIDTGRRKLGAILGDGVLTGCNCVLHPGVRRRPGDADLPGRAAPPRDLPREEHRQAAAGAGIVPQELRQGPITADPSAAGTPGSPRCRSPGG